MQEERNSPNVLRQVIHTNRKQRTILQQDVPHPLQRGIFTTFYIHFYEVRSRSDKRRIRRDGRNARISRSGNRRTGGCALHEPQGFILLSDRQRQRRRTVVIAAMRFQITAQTSIIPHIRFKSNNFSKLLPRGGGTSKRIARKSAQIPKFTKGPPGINGWIKILQLHRRRRRKQCRLPSQAESDLPTEKIPARIIGKNFTGGYDFLFMPTKIIRSTLPIALCFIKVFVINAIERFIGNNVVKSEGLQKWDNARQGTILRIAENRNDHWIFFQFRRNCIRTVYGQSRQRTGTHGIQKGDRLHPDLFQYFKNFHAFIAGAVQQAFPIFCQPGFYVETADRTIKKPFSHFNVSVLPEADSKRPPHKNPQSFKPPTGTTRTPSRRM